MGTTCKYQGTHTEHDEPTTEQFALSLAFIKLLGTAGLFLQLN